VLQAEIAEQRARGDRDVAHAALDEIARGRRLGKDDQIDRRLELGELRQHAADPLHVGGVLALGGADLGDGEAGHGCGGKIIGAEGAVMRAGRPVVPTLKRGLGNALS